MDVTRREFMWTVASVASVPADTEWRLNAANTSVAQGRTTDLYALPPDLPAPADDGACRHLTGMAMPPVRLRSTSNRWVDIRGQAGMRTVVYCYPRTGQPDKDPGPGWDDIPGARGCTPETCAFRDHHEQLRQLGADVYGVSTQTTAYQQEM